MENTKLDDEMLKCKEEFLKHFAQVHPDDLKEFLWESEQCYCWQQKHRVNRKECVCTCMEDNTLVSCAKEFLKHFPKADEDRLNYLVCESARRCNFQCWDIYGEKANDYPDSDTC